MEDFFNFRLTMRRMLRSFNINDIDEAADGEDAVKKLSYKKYDIILCDYNLGAGKDGQQVLEEAKFRGYIDYSNIFIMVTALNTTDMVMGALEYQPDDYLIKPFTKMTLEKKLRDSIRKKENLKNIERAIEKNDYANAIAICDELIRSNTRNRTELLKLKGEILTKKGDYTEAAVFYEDVLSMGNLPWAMLGLGKSKFITGDYDAAKDIFEKIIAKNDKNVAAYDWLALTHEKMGNPKEAQKVLQDAILISPKAILRQKALGNIAYKNKDYITAEQSFKEAVKQGKHSFFKSPSDYTSLAKVFVERNVPEEGLKVLNDAAKEFINSPEAALQISVTESLVYKRMNREKDARKALAKATQLSTTLPDTLPFNVELDFAKAFFLTGNEDSGKAIVRRLIQSNHEDQELISDVQAVFRDLNIAEKGREIISMARNEIIKLNNEGVRLVREGNLSKAIEFFEQAAANLPTNKVINANAAHAIILYMQKNGSESLLLDKAMKYLDRVKNIDPAYKDLENLMKMCNNLSREE
ncbi:MAG TPA: tetratricopeptide repeat protein [Syntrophales bacterium]|nr:tetratricopeptide repeat protein [Syntrophales bacterium]